MTPNSAIGDVLFTRTQQRVLGLLFSRPEQSFYLNEIVRLAGVGKGTVKRELDRLNQAGLITFEQRGNQNHYQANADCAIFNELRGIVLKTFGVGEAHAESATKEPPGILNTDELDMGALESSHQKPLVIGGEIEVSRVALQQLARHYHIKRLSLFGSAARRELKPGSDIDLLVEFDPNHTPSLGEMVDVHDAFEKLFKGYKVDIAIPSILIILTAENP
ncbi:MAG: nucleotidyltransferase domain-containing protein [Cellvibrionaceae bacterium]